LPSVAKALCDTGPLVAMADRFDALHGKCVDAFSQFGGSLVTTWPVLTEAFYFLDNPYSRNFLWEFIVRPAVQVADTPFDDLVRIRTLMTQYATLPMDFADASLVIAAERLNLRRVFTLDRRDFLLYRPRNVAAFDVFP
jgi:predicted nucleic acid-binding protein